MRLTKNDPTGNYAYFTDGLSPASAVLSDNYSTFTPGISEYNALGTRFYLADASGNSRGLLDSTQAATDGYNWDAFGNLVSRFGSNPTMFAWNEASGYQTDNDDGLTLPGHRYYDKRTGRFISQDPAGDGDNWYGYAGNDPMNGTDPDGLDYIDCSRVPSDWQQQALANDSSYNGQDVSWDSSGILHWSDGTNDHSYSLNDMSGGAAWSASSWITAGTGSASLGDGNAINTGFGEWVDSQASFGLASAAGKAWGM